MLREGCVFDSCYLSQTDPGTFRTSSAEQQALEPELALLVATAQNVTCTTIMEREIFFPISEGNTEKSKFST